MKRKLEMSTEFFLIPTTTTKATATTTTTTTTDQHAVLTKNLNYAGILKNEPWVIPALTLSSITMLLIISFEVFVLCKALKTIPSRRHLFLGQMLLLGLFACSALGATLAATPTQLTCALTRFGIGVAYAVVFATLLVKCVFLISLNGGVYLPASYQGLLLFFAVLIQVAINVQWLITNPPRINKVYENNRNKLVLTYGDFTPVCNTNFNDVLMSLIYVVFLIFFVVFLAIKSRGIRDNYRESKYIGLSIIFALITFFVWIVSGFMLNEDASTSFGLISFSLSVFLVMFMPKGRQLAAMGKEGVYVEDREERFSSLSRNGSGYSPSFFHFKPVKCGIGYGKHPQNGGVNTLGDNMAVYPPPPSYTRLFQYQYQYHQQNPPGYYSNKYLPGGVYLRPDDGNVYTTLEPTLSTNPNVYFQRGNSSMHPGMMY